MSCVWIYWSLNCFTFLDISRDCKLSIRYLYTMMIGPAETFVPFLGLSDSVLFSGSYFNARFNSITDLGLLLRAIGSTANDSSGCMDLDPARGPRDRISSGVSRTTYQVALYDADAVRHWLIDRSCSFLTTFNLLSISHWTLDCALLIVYGMYESILPSIALLWRIFGVVSQKTICFFAIGLIPLRPSLLYSKRRSSSVIMSVKRVDKKYD